jgi:hypothetical protein
VRERSAVVTWRKVPSASVVTSPAATIGAPTVLSWCSTKSFAPPIGLPFGAFSTPVMRTLRP